MKSHHELIVHGGRGKMKSAAWRIPVQEVISQVHRMIGFERQHSALQLLSTLVVTHRPSPIKGMNMYKQEKGRERQKGTPPLFRVPRNDADKNEKEKYQQTLQSLSKCRKHD